MKKKKMVRKSGSIFSDKNMKILSFIAHIPGLTSFIYLIAERVLGYNIDVIVAFGLVLSVIIFFGWKTNRGFRALIARIDVSYRDLISRIDRLETDVKKIKESLPRDQSKTP